MLTLSIFAAILAPAADAEAGKGFPKPKGDLAEAIRVLGDSLKVVESSDTSDRERQCLLVSAQRARKLLAAQSPAAERLSTATIDNADRVVRDVFDSLSFVPIREAELPRGAPTYTPVGAIEVKRYPKCRRAVAGGFVTLFSHIKKNKVAMTTPVQMDYEITDSGGLKQKNMAFFYGSTTIGKTGRQGRVNIVEDKPMTVIANGVRGRRNNDVIRDRISRLQKWIDEHKDYETAGPIRLMGYNSPFVPASKQFYEVQIPIRKVDSPVSVAR